MSDDEIVPYAEVVDGEFVPDYNDIRWIQWYSPDKETTCFRMEIDQSWYLRVPREDWSRLNALLGEIADLVRRTSTRGPRVATAAERVENHENPAN